MISPEQYKYDACGITNDECCGVSCRGCETAMVENSKNKIEEAKADRERYTRFERSSYISGIKVMIDVCNVIAKTDLDTLKHLQENTEFVKKTTIAYHPDNLKQYAENLRKLRRYNGLGIPDMIWGATNYPAAFLFGEVVYLIAPRIEQES